MCGTTHARNQGEVHICVATKNPPAPRLHKVLSGSTSQEILNTSYCWDGSHWYRQCKRVNNACQNVGGRPRESLPGIALFLRRMATREITTANRQCPRFRRLLTSNSMHTEIDKRLASLPKTEASFVEPMDCLSVSKLPEGLGWIWEIKLD